jgi:hypothetical protein
MKMKKTKSTNTLVKTLVILIPIILIGYVLANQFLIFKEFNYFYDIGSKEDTNYLTPDYRITEKIIEENNYREATNGLVYFYVDPPRGFTDVKVRARIKDNFPENTIMSIGVRDQKEWHYNYNLVFDSKEDKTDDWIIVETTFNIEKNNITLINNGRLSLLFRTPHLANNETKDYTIPIDWINITIYKPSIFEKWK